MNEEPPTPFEVNGDEPVEARIVAWVLGEASAFEAAELQRLCEERPELLVFRRRMRALHGLLTEAEATEPDLSWKLPADKRKVLDEIFGKEKVTFEARTEQRIRYNGRRAFIAIAACIVLTMVVLQLVQPIWIGQPAVKSAVKSVDFMPASGSGGESDDSRQSLAQAIRDQEDKVEERRKVLATMVRTKGIVFKGQSSSYGPSGVDEDQGAIAATKDEAREDSIKRGLDAQDYAGAKMDFEADQQLLQTLKLRQIDEKVGRKHMDESIAVQDDSFRSELMKQKAVPSQPASPAAPSDGAFNLSSAAKDSDPKAGIKEAARQSQIAKQTAKPISRTMASGAASSPAELETPAAIEELPAIAGTGKGMGGGGLGQGEAMDAFVPQSKAAPAKSSSAEAVQTLQPLAENARRLNRSRAELGKELKASGRMAGGRGGEPWGSDARSLESQSGAGENPNTEGIQDANGQKDELALNQKNPGTSSDRTAQDTDSSEEHFEDVDLTTRDKSKPAVVDPSELSEEITAAENPYSTFSLNISDASFQLAKAALDKGERPDPAGIKAEQFYNAVDYGDPAPAADEPVAATVEQSAHPILPGRNLVRVSVRTGSTGRSAVQPLRLTLLVDQSGSMVREDRRASMDHALAQLSVLLTKADSVSVIGFSRSAHLLAEGLTGDKAMKLGDLVNQTASEGGTNLEEAMKLGGQLAERQQLAGAQNRIVLFTDGAANLGDADPRRLAALVKSFRQKGLAFDIAGIGADGLNDRLLSELARNGNGRYYVVGNEKNDSFARQLAGAFRPTAENVKVQVRFNPQRVGSYKLIGFEKDRLKTEDFRNDAVDAAELAAEEAGVAIYQIEPLSEGRGEIGEISVRFRNAASGEMVERTWTVPYSSQATSFDQASPSMQLAGLSLLAAEKLKGGPLADAIDFNDLSGPGAFVKQSYAASPRVGEMLQLIERLK